MGLVPLRGGMKIVASEGGFKQLIMRTPLTADHK